MSSDSYAAAEWILGEAESHVRRAAPGTGVVAEVFVGDPASMLLSRAQGAALVVVGNRGTGGIRGLQVGSVSAALAAQAPCPVVVVRPHREGTAFRASPRGQVVVGVDGTEMSTPAVRFALQEAARRHVGVIAVHVSTTRGPHPTYDHMRVPGIPFHTKLVRSHPALALIDESADAELVVVGSHGRGGLVAAQLGSVSQAVLEHAACPVAVVRPRLVPAANSWRPLEQEGSCMSS
jgi:nucleotide-binding universal stress UspA family protein